MVVGGLAPLFYCQDNYIIYGERFNFQYVVVELNSNKVFYKDISFDNISFEAGAVGTRAVQLMNQNAEGYAIIGVSVSGVANSSEIIPIAFTSSGKIYLNLYRATTNAVIGNRVIVRLLYIKP